jgi:hypothetical protein
MDSCSFRYTITTQFHSTLHLAYRISSNGLSRTNCRESNVVCPISIILPIKLHEWNRQIQRMLRVLLYLTAFVAKNRFTSEILCAVCIPPVVVFFDFNISCYF